jgi:hypothetical protein
MGHVPHNFLDLQIESCFFFWWWYVSLSAITLISWRGLASQHQFVDDSLVVQAENAKVFKSLTNLTLISIFEKIENFVSLLAF